MKRKQRSNKKSRCVFFGLIFFSVFGAHAQFRQEKLIKPVISAGFLKSFSSSLADTSGEYGYDKPFIAIKVPLYSRLSKGRKAGSFSFFGILLNTGGSYSWPGFSWLPPDMQLVNAQAGLSSIFYPGKKSVWLAGFQMLLAEDNKTINHPHFLYSGSLLMVHRVSTVFSYMAGASYSYVYGRGLPLPILGVKLNLGKRSKMTMVLPFSVSYTYRTGEKNQFGAFLKPEGGVNRISNEGLFAGYSSPVTFRQRSLHAGINFLFFVGPSFGICPEMGLHNRQNLSFVSGNGNAGDSFLQAKTNAGIYLKLTLSYRFGTKPYHGDNDAINYLIQNGIDNLPLPDVE